MYKTKEQKGKEIQFPQDSVERVAWTRNEGNGGLHEGTNGKISQRDYWWCTSKSTAQILLRSMNLHPNDCEISVGGVCVD